MKSLARIKINDLARLYETLDDIQSETPVNEWESLSQQDLFNLVTSRCKKQINPSTIQKEIARLEQFELPRNVQSEHDQRGWQPK